MKSILLSLLFLFIASINNPEDKSTITLEKHFKVESTFSGNTSNNESFHLIIAKNTKQKRFEIIPISNKSGELNKLNAITFKKLPSIISFHNNEEKVSLIVSVKPKKEDMFTVIDVDLNTGTIEKSKFFSGKDFKSVIRKKDENLLLFANKNQLKIVKTSNSKTVSTVSVKATPKTKSLLKDLSKEGVDAINTNEFVANGSINKFRAYSEGDDVIITREDVKNGNTAVSRIPLNEGNSIKLEEKTYESQSSKKSKKSTSFVDSNKLFQLKMDKKNADLNIYNLTNDDNKSIDLKTAKISNKSKDFETFSDFLKQSSKAVNEPTVAVNKTNSGDVVLRVDYVNKNDYSYNYNWWWHHQWMWQQQMLFQQQQMQMRANIPNRFGPNPLIDILYVAKRKSHFFEIVINNNNEIKEDKELQTIHKFIDKKKHIEALDKDVKIKHASTVFLDNNMRYFGYDKKSKSFKVISKSIND